MRTERSIQICWLVFILAVFGAAPHAVAQDAPSSGDETFLQIARDFGLVVISIVGTLTVIASMVGCVLWVLRLRKVRNEVQDAARQGIDFIDRAEPFLEFIARADAFLKFVIPDLLSGFQKRELIDDKCLANWARILSSDLHGQQSLRQLNELGQEIIHKSGIKEFIDSHLGELTEELWKHRLPVVEEIEVAAFVALEKFIKDLEDGESLFEPYLYSNPNISMQMLAYVGSLYLRDKFLEANPEWKDAKAKTHPDGE